jgi:hypothetical protein
LVVITLEYPGKEDQTPKEEYAVKIELNAVAAAVAVPPFPIPPAPPAANIKYVSKVNCSSETITIDDVPGFPLNPTAEEPVPAGPIYKNNTSGNNAAGNIAVVTAPGAPPPPQLVVAALLGRPPPPPLPTTIKLINFTPRGLTQVLME